MDSEVISWLKRLERRMQRQEAKSYWPLLGEWFDWTPVVSQNGARTSTINFARYMASGKFVTVQAEVVITNAGTAGQAVLVSGFPAAIQHLHSNAAHGSVCGDYKYDRAGIANYSGVAAAFGADTVGFFVEPGAGGNLVGIVPSFATANGDELSFLLEYETP